MTTQRLNPVRQSKSLALADLVAEQIGSRFTVPTRTELAPRFELKKISGREVVVWTQGRACEMLTRSSQTADYEVVVVVLQRLATLQEDEDEQLQDELLAFVESIGDQLCGETLEFDHGSVEIKGFEHETLYDREALESHRIFASAIVLMLTREEDLPNR